MIGDRQTFSFVRSGQKNMFDNFLIKFKQTARETVRAES